MSLCVVGSTAYDNIRAPTGEVSEALGGSVVYFSLAASLFAPVRLVSIVGGDFDRKHISMLGSRSIDTSGLEIVPGKKTFRWTGEYSPDMNDRETLEVHLNVLEDFRPTIPESYRDSRFLFLANGAPVTQLSVLDQVKEPELVVADTMDLWITTEREDLLRLLERIDGLIITDSEAHLLTGVHGVIRAGRRVLEMGPSFVVLKKGEHGAVLFTREQTVPLPAYPTATVVDPTGAGDSFAGAMMGCLARAGEIDAATFRRGIAYGAVAASFTVEDFGTRRLESLTEAEARARYEEYASFLRI